MSDKQLVILLRYALKEANENMFWLSLGVGIVSFAIGWLIGLNGAGL